MDTGNLCHPSNEMFNYTMFQIDNAYSPLVFYFDHYYMNNPLYEVEEPGDEAWQIDACEKIVNNDLAKVTVKMASKTYFRVKQSVRVGLADQIANLGLCLIKTEKKERKH